MGSCIAGAEECPVFGTPLAACSGEVIYADAQTFAKVHTDGPKIPFSLRLANRRHVSGFASVDSRDAGCANGNLRRGLLRRLCLDRPAAATGVCAANLPWSRLHLDAGLLGLGPE
jgi:hypothetical protein